MKISKLIICMLALVGILGMSANYLPFEGTQATGSYYYINIATNPANGFIKASNMAPGDKVTSVLEVQNKGNVDFKYTISARRTDGAQELYDIMLLKVFNSEGEQLYEGGFNGLQDFPLGSIAHFDKTNLTVTAEFPIQAGNEYQRKSTTVAFDFRANHVVQPDGECFCNEPPFNNRTMTLQKKSVLPIEFHLDKPDGYSSSGWRNDVRLVITGMPKTYEYSVKQGTLKYYGNLYNPTFKANFKVPDIKEDTYECKAIVYVGNTIVCEKEFVIKIKDNRC
jgi:hypothetical protein